MYEAVPGFQTDSIEDDASLSISKFLYHNGFANIHEVDVGGWAPLHYAALRGDQDLIKSLLAQQADLQALTKKDAPMVAGVLGMSPLAVALAVRHNDAARLLISARAELGKYELGMASAMDNAEGVRMLCEAGCKPDTRWIFDVPVFFTACQWGSLKSMKELFNQSGETLNLSQALFFAVSMKGSRAEVVQWLIDSKADVNETYIEPPLLSAFGLFHAVFSLKHRLGTVSPASQLCFHTKGRTPLMTAIFCGNYEAAAVLISAEARLDSRTARGLTAADFATKQSPPDFLFQAFNGDKFGCHRVASLALAGSVVSVKM